MTDSGRIRFNRTLFSAELNGGPPADLVRQLAAEDIELIIDVRATPSAESRTTMDALCEQASIYYVTATGDEEREPRWTGWAAGLSLRHNTCVVGDVGEARLVTSAEIADAAGQRVIDLASAPAPITLGVRTP
jgi:hypothetical protein